MAPPADVVKVKVAEAVDTDGARSAFEIINDVNVV